MNEERIYTAESVTSGHPDKLCDLIADTILDECLTRDADSRVACEVMLAHDKCLIAGEITTVADVDFIQTAKEAISSVGYDSEMLEFECRIRTQSQDIAQAVNGVNQGAGDQGVMFGYACDETLNFMPLCAELAHRLTDRLEFCRRERVITGLLPDGKAQVSIAYKNDRFDRIVSIVISSQHTEQKTLAELEREIRAEVIASLFEEYDLNQAEILVNPSGRFILGGFEADTGLTGRKLMVDSYGGTAHHGGGAFSGKDPSKVDRSGAYMARYIAKNIVGAGLAEKCEVMLSYAIGKASPTAVDVNTFGTAVCDERKLTAAIRNVFDLTPRGIISALELTLPIYAQTAVGGHFGKPYLMWEQLNKVGKLKQALLV